MKRILPISLDNRDANLILVEPDDRPAVAVLLWLPAMGTPAKVYLPFAEKLCEKGWSVVLCDYRGHGESGYIASREENFGFVDILESDLSHYWALVRGIYPTTPVFIGGHSLGGQFASLFSGTIQDDVNGVVLVASGLPFYKLFPGLKSFGMNLSVRFIRMMAKINGFYPGDKIGFGGNEGKDLILDWAHCALNGDYNLINSDKNWEEVLGGQHQPILSISLSADNYAPRKCIDALVEKMPVAEASIQELVPSMFASGSADHFSWIKESGPVVRKIVRWA